MSRLNPDKLSVEFREGVAQTEPITSRRYTLTHSDITAELFLTIGLTYAYDKINSIRDEVLGHWINIGEGYFYYVYLYVGDQFCPSVSAMRDAIFRKELPLALEAIRYGDRKFFSVHLELDHVPIVVHFNSMNPYINRIEKWGTFQDYKLKNQKL